MSWYKRRAYSKRFTPRRKRTCNRIGSLELRWYLRMCYDPSVQGRTDNGKWLSRLGDDSAARSGRITYRSVWPTLGKPNPHAHHWKVRRGRR